METPSYEHMTQSITKTVQAGAVGATLTVEDAMTILGIKADDKKSRQAVVQTFQALEKQGLGQFRIGRREHPSRFIRGDGTAGPVSEAGSAKKAGAAKPSGSIADFLQAHAEGAKEDDPAVIVRAVEPEVAAEEPEEEPDAQEMEAEAEPEVEVVEVKSGQIPPKLVEALRARSQKPTETSKPTPGGSSIPLATGGLGDENPPKTPYVILKIELRRDFVIHVALPNNVRVPEVMGLARYFLSMDTAFHIADHTPGSVVWIPDLKDTEGNKILPTED